MADCLPAGLLWRDDEREAIVAELFKLYPLPGDKESDSVAQAQV